MERIRGGLRHFLESGRIPSQIELNIVILDEPIGDIEPGVYIRTNIPARVWKQNPRGLRREVANTLLTNEKLQQSLGEEDTDIKIPIGEDVEAVPARGILLWHIANNEKTGCVVLKAERGPIGEAVKALNIPQVRESLISIAKKKQKQKK